MNSSKFPLISVILPTYNGSRFLEASIASVLEQSYPNLELIVIDDASSDVKVREIVLRFQSSHGNVSYVRNEVNMERSASKNRWAGLAHWDFLAFIDDDDVWTDPEKLAKQMGMLRADAQIWIVGTYVTCVDERYRNIGFIATNLTDENIRKRMLLTNQFVQSSVLMRKDVFIKAGRFDEKMNLCEDYDLWLRAWKYAKMGNVPEYCTQYMVRLSNTTSKNSMRMKRISFLLVLKYGQYYPGFLMACVLRCGTFFIPMSLIVRIKGLVWKK